MSGEAFKQDLEKLINKHSQENRSGTPDFILAEYIQDCLNAFSAAVNRREAWYGREQDQFGMPIHNPPMPEKSHLRPIKDNPQA